MNTSELMKAMADAGAPFEAILIAVQALDAKDAEIAERDREQAEKRAKDADRKRLDRANGKPSRRRPRTIHGRSKDCPMDPPIEEFIPPVSSDEETTPQSKLKASAKPEDVEPEVWTGFVAQRRACRAAVTPTAIDGIRREAVKAGWSLNDALAEVASRGWRGFKAEWVIGKPAAPLGGSSDYMATMLAKQAANA